MQRKVGLIDVFTEPYEAWTWRRASQQEALDLLNHGVHPSQAMEVKDKLIAVVSTPVEAASRMLDARVDNGLEHHVDAALYSSAEYQTLQSLMPSDEPPALSAYQGSFTEHDWAPADAAIKSNGVEMADGQFLFHGGLWPSESNTFITTRPFSTSFCPQVALRNAEWRGKAYDSGRVDLMVVRVTRSETKAYAYNLEGDHGNEKEIVFASGAILRRVRESQLADIPVSKVTLQLKTLEKVVPAYLVEVELS
ncbi:MULTISPECIES: hypothetical protein [unclassified Pseudomonas]|uniref:hypothetical protein n=1 Tax=unclassified Pseudomonas TaxID=196821 RepID=UPI00244A7550|nr:MULTISPECIES: hypothetical protein [unclassified Pseudomonas]MDG9929042.1 hypothetical protein [Pseudomonas sp. GD04042]MDH0483755.1 hypothetical protein [Pseudomonas sp. GD04015]MDH0604946.1 hypothetical protein [Pseudomonas sp. GD03869]